MRRMTTRFAWAGLVAALLFVAGPALAVAQSTVKNYFEGTSSGGDNIFHIGGTAYVESGGILQVKTGGLLKNSAGDTFDLTQSGISNAVAGVGASYKVARGNVTLDGSNPTTAATGLTTVVQCVAQLQATSAPAVTFLTAEPSTTNINIYAWAPTAAGNTALAASTNSALVVSWICVGT